jgi:hypothetical protein
MRSLRHYIAESVHTYDCTIKIAGEVSKDFLELFLYNLKKFVPVEKPETKTTPIQKSPYGFPNLENQPITIIKCKFRYPATEPMIQQMAQLLGHNVDFVRLVNTSYDDSIDNEMDEYENQMKHSPVLTHEEMEEEKGSKAAAKAYGNQYLDSIKEQSKDDQLTMSYAGEKTKPAFDPFKPYTDDKQMGIKSPMSQISRPAKPKTGAMGPGRY